MFSISTCNYNFVLLYLALSLHLVHSVTPIIFVARDTFRGCCQLTSQVKLVLQFPTLSPVFYSTIMLTVIITFPYTQFPSLGDYPEKNLSFPSSSSLPLLRSTNLEPFNWCVLVAILTVDRDSSMPFCKAFTVYQSDDFFLTSKRSVQMRSSCF